MTEPQQAGGARSTVDLVSTPLREPIAIIGIGCRFPGGANDPAQFWRLLSDGVDAISNVPEDRWRLAAFYDPDPAKPGKTYIRQGGFITGIDLFDAAFFGMSPREATRADPQQRILMEVAYQAVEDAGIPPERLAGTNTGVFIGIATLDYGGIQSSTTERRSINAYTNLGLALCIAANRLSYLFDLHGPSLAVDTACSSSLVAAHLACQSIWRGECDMALTGGVNLILRPEGTIGFSKASMLAPDGRCKSFDARADGYVRSEGAGVVVLKPVSRALADGDPIYAVVRGTAVNQDGRTTGISLPNRAAQEAMLREACRSAGVAPEQVQFIEAHGTGTPVGDPIELTAIGNVLGSRRSTQNTCVVGSVKTNIGHLEAASGVAGLIKAALTLKHRQIPPNLHFETPNPEIAFEALKLRVPQTVEPWPDTGGAPRLAGVNSFGFGGTNAHVILEAAPERRETGSDGSRQAVGPALLVPLSARSSEALEARAQSLMAFLADQPSSGDVSLHDIGYTASLRRGHHDHRLTAVARSTAELAEQLEAFLAGETRPYNASGRQVVSRSHKLAFVFSGMGPQWWAMGRQLLDDEPVFGEVIKQCDALLGQLADWSLWEELTADEARSRIDRTNVAQPAIFALQVGLAALWRSWGVEPAAIVGHSVGEVAAAHVAGALSLEDAVRLIFHRSRLQQRAAGQGSMLAVGLPVEEAERLLAGWEDRVSIAAINSPSDVTLSGDADVLEDIATSLRQKSVFGRFLQVEVPYHSPRMDPLRPELLDSLRDIRPQPATIPMFSTATGEAVDGRELDAAYWWHNMRNPVRFSAALDALVHTDHDLFLEISAHPVLASSITKCLAQTKKEGAVLPSLRRDEPERPLLLGSLGKLYTLGYPVDWRRQYPHGGRLIHLPSYPWQRERYWHESDQARRERLGTKVHPLLGNQVDAAYPVWSAELERQPLAYLDDHRIQDTIMYPAAGYVEMALAAAKESFGPEPCVVEDIALHRAMFLSDDEPLPVQVIRHPGQASFEIYSQANGSEPAWVRHATGKLRRLDDGAANKQAPLDALRSRCSREIAKNDFYRLFEAVGMQYGPRFQAVERLWIGEGEALGQIELPADLHNDVDDYQIHPTILDGAFQVLLGALALNGASRDQAAGVYLPVQIDQIRLYDRPGRRVYSHARLVEHGASQITGDIQLLDEAGTVRAEVHGFVCRSIERGSEKWDNYLYEYQWKLKPRSDQAAARRSAGYLPAPHQIAERLRPEADHLAERLNRRQYYEDLQPQDALLARAHILQAFQQLNWRPELDEHFSAEMLADQLGVVPQHRRLFGRLLEILAEDGLLECIDDQWKVRRIPETTEPLAIWRALWAQFPAYQAELTVIRRCGEKLAEVLRGDIDPLQLIFPEGSLTTTEHLYQDAPTYRIYNLLAQKAVAQALETLPEGRTVRVLEIGGGTGGMTNYVLRKLPADRTTYVFSDVTQLLLAHAEQKFHGYPFVQYELLDIEADPCTQGFEPHSFDLILASDVLHATRDLHHTLSNVKALLASEGLLLLLEGTKTPPSVTLTFGLLKGWWLFDDVELRGSDPWISQTAWQQVLHDAGFTDVAWVTDTDPEDRAVHSVLLARGPVVASPAEAAAAPPTEKRDRWLIFADGKGVGQQLAEQLAVYGSAPILVSAGPAYRRVAADRFEVRPTHLEDIQQLVDEALAGLEPCRGVIHLWSLDAAPSEETTAAALESAQRLGTVNVLYVAQALAKANGSETPQLWLVTSGAQVAGESTQAVSYAQSPLWGLGRVIINEHPQLRCRLVDLGSAVSADEIQSLVAELRADDGEDEIALRADARYVHRLRHVSLLSVDGLGREHRAAKTQQPFRVEIAKPGILDHLTFTETPRREPGPGEVEIRVHAVGLNFKDVMIAMGLLPDEALKGGYTGKALGMECAGTIVAVGPGVEGLMVGDAVMTSAPGALRTNLTVDARFVVRKPDHVSFEEAATIPITFLTAYYSLNYLGHMRAGDRVLIHAAAGGVGLAAIQLAQRAGAEVFATAGTPAKRDLLRALGVRYVMDSRSLAFADEVMRFTGGEGVDIVLNSLAGEAIPKSLSVLRAYGRFIEIGKRDIYEDSKLGLRPFRNNLSLFAVDLDKLCAQRPGLVQSFLHDVMQAFEDGSLRPLPHRVFSVSDIVSAFRYMAQAKHIGKVVVSMQDEVVVTPEVHGPLALREDGTYLITGGLGGLGLTVAQWLVDRGARHLVLMGRSGASARAAEAAITAMRSVGATVVVAMADVTRESEVAAVLTDIRQSMPPLRGVIHAAMVLDDALLPQLDEERMAKVMAPKMVGAWNVHTQTVTDPLEFFVSFSSFTSLIGNPGQGNYVAANAFLDAFAYHRRLQGLPALTVNWGAVSGVGYVAQNPEIGQRLAHVGVKSLPAQQLLRILDALLQRKAVQIGVGHIDWPQLGKVHLFQASPRLAHLMEATRGDEGEGEGTFLVDALLAVDPAERQQFLSTQIRDQLARLLGMSPAKVDIEQPLLNLGLDSLMAVEIGHQIQAMVGVEVPTMKFMEGLSIAGLSAYVIDQLSGGEAPAAAPPSAEQIADEVLEQVEQLSDEEVDALLHEMVAGEVSEDANP